MIDARAFADCRNCLCLAARREARRLTRAYDARLRPYSLTSNQFSLLAILILAGPLPVTMLAEQLGIDRTTLTRNVDLGVANGLVVVRPARDARVRLVAITAAGRAAAERALPAWRAAQEEFAKT